MRSALEIAKKIQPISTTGFFAHTYYWLTSPGGDQTYKNPSYKNELEQDSGIAIYFIHGTGDQPAAFQRIAERLLEEKLPVEICSLILLAFDQRYHGKSIAVFAEQLRDKINANQHQRVILVAHSRGGLVASYFAEFLAKVAGIKVLLIFPVSSPFNGSYLAIKPLTWLSDSVREMEIDSRFLDKLKKKILVNTDIRYHFFIAQEDGIVPGESGFIKEYVDNHPNSLHILDRHGHLSVMSSHRLVSQIASLIHDYFKSSRSNSMEVVVSKMAEFTLVEDYLPSTINLTLDKKT